MLLSDWARRASRAKSLFRNEEASLDRACPADPPRIPVSLLTGFLGSGRTTVLNGLLTHAALGRALVIINELGGIARTNE